MYLPSTLVSSVHNKYDEMSTYEITTVEIALSKCKWISDETFNIGVMLTV